MGALFLGQLAAAGLLRFQVLVKEIQRLLVRLGASHDGEHALTGVIVGRLGDRDPSSRAPPDLRDLGTAPADNAANHVRRNADVLGLDLLTILGDQGKAAVGGVGVGASAVTTAAGLVTEVGAVTGPVVGAAVVTVVARAGGVRGATDVGAHGRVVEDGAGSSLPVIDQALADFPNSLFDAFGSSLHLDNALGRLREHFLLRNHAHARSILDVLDLKTLASDDGAHLVMGDEESHRCRETVSLVTDGNPPGGEEMNRLTVSPVVGDDAAHAHLGSAFEQAPGDDSVGSSGAVERTGDGQDAVVYTRNDFAHTGFHTGLVAEIGDVLAGLADDDASLLGRNNGAKGEHGLGIFLLSLGGDVQVGLIHGDGISHGLVDDGLVDIGSVHYYDSATGSSPAKANKRRIGEDY